MTRWIPKIRAWRRPLWPITVAIVVADIAIGILILNGTDPVVGTVAVVVTVAWLYVAESIGQRLNARNSPNT